jgi:V/A-type H+/Na+-transporting ATPase subunit K
MISKRLAKHVFVCSLVVAATTPAVALAEGMTNGDGVAAAGKAIGAALAMGMAALGAGWAQAKIGSAGQGTLAERPEERIWVIALTALPEVIVLLGFVMAILLAGGE